MSVKVAIPVHRVRCRVWIDDSRDWSVVHEALMLALARSPWSLERLGAEMSLRRQVVVAAVARLMRHRLLEVVIADGAVAFQASPAGLALVNDGRYLPRFPREVPRTYGLVVERFSGSCFRSREVSLQSVGAIERLRGQGARIKDVEVSTGTSGISHEVAFENLIELVERGGDRRLLRIDDNSVVLNEDRFMLVDVVDGVARLPPSARPEFTQMIVGVAGSEPSRVEVETVPGAGRAATEPVFLPVTCDVSSADIVIGNSSHAELVRDVIASASRRVVIHSTFLDVDKFRLLGGTIRQACARNVKLDILWGAEAEDPSTGRNAAAAGEISREASADPLMRGSVRMQMATTGSHAKIILADQADGSWLAVVSSCNWLSTPFQSVEMSVVLRHPLAVADVMTVLQKTVGRRPISDSLANELAITANDLRRNRPEPSGTAKVTVLVGAAHEALMRRASGEATGRILVGTHRIGGTIRPSVILPAALAVSRGTEVSVLYTQPSKPMTRQEARAIEASAVADGIRFSRAKKPEVHGKLLLWTPDDIAVTSHNWGSASTNSSFPFAEVGIHVQAPGLANVVLAKLEVLYPELWRDHVSLPRDD